MKIANSAVYASLVLLFTVFFIAAQDLAAEDWHSMKRKQSYQDSGVQAQIDAIGRQQAQELAAIEKARQRLERVHREVDAEIERRKKTLNNLREQARALHDKSQGSPGQSGW